MFRYHFCYKPCCISFSDAAHRELPLRNARATFRGSERAAPEHPDVKALALLEIMRAAQPDRPRYFTLSSRSSTAGPVGLKTISASLEEEATIEEVNEPYLMQLGFPSAPPRTHGDQKGYEHIGADAPRSQQQLI